MSRATASHRHVRYEATNLTLCMSRLHPKIEDPLNMARRPTSVLPRCVCFSWILAQVRSPSLLGDCFMFFTKKLSLGSGSRITLIDDGPSLYTAKDRERACPALFMTCE